MTPNLNQPPRLKMGKLVPERPSGLTKDTQLLDRREDLAAFIPRSAPHYLLTDTRPSSPRERLHVAISFWLLFSCPEEKGSGESKCGRWSDGQIRSHTFRGEKSMPLLQRTQINQLYLTLLSPATIDKTIGRVVPSDLLPHR